MSLKLKSEKFKTQIEVEDINLNKVICVVFVLLHYL